MRKRFVLFLSCSQLYRSCLYSVATCTIDFSLQEKGDILSLQMAEKEKTFAEKEQQLREAHRSQVNQLNQEILMLTIKVVMYIGTNTSTPTPHPSPPHTHTFSSTNVLAIIIMFLYS